MIGTFLLRTTRDKSIVPCEIKVRIEDSLDVIDVDLSEDSLDVIIADGLDMLDLRLKV